MHQILEILEQSTASAGPDLISLDDLKLALGITGNTEDAQLQAAITQQSQIIAEYCHRRFGMAEALETFTFDPYEGMRRREALVLSLYPVSEIFEVSIAGATAADFHFDPDSGRVWLSSNQWPYGSVESGYWPYGPSIGSVMVTYSGGYDLPEQAPARLQQAVIMQVGRGRMSGLRDPTIREVQHGDTRIGYYTANLGYGSNDFLGAVTDLITPYRRIYIA